MPGLSALKVKSLTAPGRYSDGGGLYIQVRDPEHRSWLFRYTRHGKAHWMGLGPLRDVTLAEAREAARECRRRLLQGVDPISHRRIESAAGMTFREVAVAYIAAHEPTWRNPVHRAQWRSTLESYVYPVFGDNPVASVEVGDITRVLEPIWFAKPETASRIRGRIESILDYATARGWRTGDNPGRWKGHLANLLPNRRKVARVEHHAALPFTQLPAFMAALTAQPGIAAQALAFTILTAARTGEVIGATWSEVDLEAAVWAVPGKRMKAGRDHRVPLSPPALAILRDMAQAGTAPTAFVFRGGKRDKPLSNMAMSAVLRRMGREGVTVHGMRSALRDWTAETTNYPREVAEMALAHTIRDGVEAAYRRGDLYKKRAEMMAEWARFACDRNIPLAHT